MRGFTCGSLCAPLPVYLPTLTPMITRDGASGNSRNKRMLSS